MKLVTFATGGTNRLGAVIGDRVFDLQAASTALPGDMVAFLALGHDGIHTAAQVIEQVRAGRADQNRLLLPLSAVALKAPVLRPEKIIGIGLNYLDHCREMGRDPPTEIRTFGMFANTLIGMNEPIWLSRNSTKMDWEAELVVVIGRRGKYIAEDQALGHVAGYTVGNDVSARDHQAADPATMRGKSGDTHAPLGPWIVTADEIPDPGALAIELRVNGIVKQSSNTAQLVFGVPKLISFLSQYVTLAPGDLIFTGTPSGVGAGRKPPEWLNPGDRIDVTIEGIGTLTNPCIAEPDQAP
jgi:2-keto-4-pentenoate hydratase/2-oxohepta-3-ene-1,7-dioic acid hydratase in catechol pathway